MECRGVTPDDAPLKNVAMDADEDARGGAITTWLPGGGRGPSAATVGDLGGRTLGGRQ